jgi:hypothetical protein
MKRGNCQLNVFLWLMVVVIVICASCGGPSKEMKMAIKEQRPDGTRIFVVFWEPGLGTPSENSDAILLMDDGSTCAPPKGFPSSIKSKNFQSGKEVCIKFFSVPKTGNPTGILIAGAKLNVRWANETEAKSFLEEMNPGSHMIR